MTCRNSKKILAGHKCNSLRINGHNSIDFLRQENGYLTDDRAARCCSLKNVKSIISDAINTKSQSKPMLVTSKNSNPLALTCLKDTAECMNTKNDEYMYDLAHFLFKISDLMLQVNAYEKKHCTKESDLRKMLNIVKTDIMKSFFKGKKTKLATMNKIVRRLTYLDKYIQQMSGNLCMKNNNNSCRKYDSSDISKNFNLKKCKKPIRGPKFCSKSAIKCSKRNLKQLNSGLKRSKLSSKYGLKSNVSSTTSGQQCRRCLDEKQIKRTERCSKKWKKSKCSIKSSGCSNKNCVCDARKSLDKKVRFHSSTELNFTPAGTSNESFKSFLTNYQDLESNKTNGPKLNPDNWVELDGHITTKELPIINKVNKPNLTEGNAQTDELMMTEDYDNQIISLNVLYSKTHVKYIIPEWMDINIDQSPKVLCKKDLDDGVALTSYKADHDGTIHFTLAYSSDDSCNMLNTEANLVTKLQEIRGIWAESARILYETLRREYEEQNALQCNEDTQLGQYNQTILSNQALIFLSDSETEILKESSTLNDQISSDSCSIMSGINRNNNLDSSQNVETQGGK